MSIHLKKQASAEGEYNYRERARCRFAADAVTIGAAVTLVVTIALVNRLGVFAYLCTAVSCQTWRRNPQFNPLRRGLVEPRGIEPLTFALRTRRSPS